MHAPKLLLPSIILTALLGFLPSAFAANVAVPFSAATTTGTWVVPAGVTSVDVQVWGAGGGGSYHGEGEGGYKGPGGGGAYAAGTLAVTPGQTLYFVVGGGGGPGWINWGGTGGALGGAAGEVEYRGGQGGGGGLSGVFSDTAKTQANALLIGGGGGGAPFWGGSGGAGGTSTATSASAINGSSSVAGGGYWGGNWGGGSSFTAATVANALIYPGSGQTPGGAATAGYGGGSRGGAGGGGSAGAAGGGGTGLVIFNYRVLSTSNVFWITPTPITYGTALSSTELSAVTTPTVPGTFTYTPVAGTVLAAGNQTLTVSFTPTDPTNYSTASANVILVVNKAPQSAPSAITFSTTPAEFGSTIAYSVSGGGGLGSAIVERSSDGGSTWSTAGITATDAVSGSFVTPGVGNYLLRARWSGDANHLASPDYQAPQQITATLRTQVLTFNGVSAISYGAAVDLSSYAFTNGGLPLVFTVDAGAATVSGSVVTPTAPGSVTVRASQAGNASYTSVTGTRTFSVNPATLTVSGISFQNKPYDGTTTGSMSGVALLSGIVGSDNVALGGSPVATFATSVAGNGITVSVTGYTLSGPDASKYTLAALQGLANITKASQTISFAAIPDKTGTSAPFDLSATASSGLPITFTLVSGPATLAGATVTTTGVAGVVTVRASQAGDPNSYSAAADVDRSFTVFNTPVEFTISPTTFVYSGSAQGPTITSSNPSTTFDTTGTPSATAVGTYSVTATANGNFSGTSGAVSWTISKATAAVNLTNLSQLYDGTPKTVTATSPSGIPVVVTYDGSSTAPTAVGSYAVSATVNDANTQGAATATLVINRLSQVIAFSTPSIQPFGVDPIVLTATASSGLPVTLTVLSGPGSLSGNVLTVSEAGWIAVRASQPGDANHNPAANVDCVIAVTPNNQTQNISVRANSSAIWETAAGTQIFRKANSSGTGVESVTIMQIKGQSSKVVNGNGTVTPGFTTNPSAVSGPDDYEHLLFGMEKDDIEK